MVNRETYPQNETATREETVTEHADEQMAHNTDRSGAGTVPVIGYPQPGDEHNWHVATADEIDAYTTYWNSQPD